MTELGTQFTCEGVRADLAAGGGLTLEQWLTDDAGRYAVSLASLAG